MGDPFTEEVFQTPTVPWQQEEEGNHPPAPQNILQPLQKIIPWQWECEIHSLLENSLHNDLVDCLPLVDHSSVTLRLQARHTDHQRLLELPLPADYVLMLVKGVKCLLMPGSALMIDSWH